jgi:hypothetical protein
MQLSKASLATPFVLAMKGIVLIQVATTDLVKAVSDGVSPLGR